MQVTFDAEPFPWHSDKTTWVFVKVPPDDADAIDDATSMTGGFGSEGQRSGRKDVVEHVAVPKQRV